MTLSLLLLKIIINVMAGKQEKYFDCQKILSGASLQNIINHKRFSVVSFHMVNVHEHNENVIP